MVLFVVPYWLLITIGDECVVLLVKHGALRLLSRLITKTKEPRIQAMFIEHLKCFFKYGLSCSIVLKDVVGHQKELVKKGILAHLVKLISSPHMQVQIKAFETLMHFDSVHQIEMIKHGILKELNKLIFSDNIQIQTKALAVIQYFDGTT